MAKKEKMKKIILFIILLLSINIVYGDANITFLNTQIDYNSTYQYANRPAWGNWTNCFLNNCVTGDENTEHNMNGYYSINGTFYLGDSSSIPIWKNVISIAGPNNDVTAFTLKIDLFNFTSNNFDTIINDVYINPYWQSLTGFKCLIYNITLYSDYKGPNKQIVFRYNQNQTDNDTGASGGAEGSCDGISISGVAGSRLVRNYINLNNSPNYLPNITSFVTNTTSIYPNDTISINISGIDVENDTLYYGTDCNYPVGGNVTFNISNILYCSYNNLGSYTNRIYLTDNIHLTNYSEYTEFTVTVNPFEQCRNGIDDDLDNYIDYSNDTGCTNLYDNNETNPIIPIIPNPGGGGPSDEIELPVPEIAPPCVDSGECYFELPDEEYIPPKIKKNDSFSFNKYNWYLLMGESQTWLEDMQIQNHVNETIRLSFKRLVLNSSVETKGWLKFTFNNKQYEEIAAVNMPKARLFALYKYIPVEIKTPENIGKKRFNITYEVKDQYGTVKYLTYVVNTGDDTFFYNVWQWLRTPFIRWDIIWCSDLTQQWQSTNCRSVDIRKILIRINLILIISILFIILLFRGAIIRKSKEYK
jgi:hypothetical protein